jgi:hypothetical protein
MNAQIEGQVGGYKSVVANWDSKSAVRAKPRRLLTPDDHGLSFFSAELTPVVSHPLVVQRGGGSVEELLTRRLYSYLDFTTVLEQEIVNPVVLRLSRDAFGLSLPFSMQFDAYRIYCDEAYHALFSADIKSQVEECTGIISGPGVEPGFARAIQRARDSVPSRLQGLVDLCATVVSETLISGSLTRIPEDLTVVSAIRESLADHAVDERTHHAYFTRVLEVCWPQLDEATRQMLGPHFADFISAFLAPDPGAQRAALAQAGFGAEDSARIIWESHPADETLMGTRHAARTTIRLLQRTGVLNDGKTEDYFSQLGLLTNDKNAPEDR